MRTTTKLALLAGLALTIGISAALVPGCNQETRTPLNQRTEQEVTPQSTQQTPTQASPKTSQDTGTQGTVITYNQYFGQQPMGPPPSGLGAGLPGITPLPYKNTTSMPSGAVVDANTGWTFQGNTFTFSNTTGGTTPTVTGTASGTASPSVTGTASGTGSQTASPSQVVSPELRARGEFTSSVPIAFGMPGSIQDQQATAVSRGSTAAPAKTSTPTANTVTVKAAQEALQQAIEGATALLGQLRGSASPQNAAAQLQLQQAIAEAEALRKQLQAATTQPATRAAE